jgi:DNA-binding transcriptional LysR family regulator
MRSKLSDALTELRDKPAGTVRITCGDYVLHSVLLPKLAPLLREYPDIKLEFDVNYGFRDIVADRFDAGVRLGKTIDKDMIAVPIGPPMRLAVVASPDYFKAHPKPRCPGSDEASVHQPAHAKLRWPLCLGFRAPRPADECACGWAADLQYHPAPD